MLYFSPLKPLLDSFKVAVQKPTETRFFMDVIINTLKHRRSTGERRNDLIDLMIDATKEDMSEDSHSDGEDSESVIKKSSIHNPHVLDEDMVIATAMVLLIAGYDTTGNTLSYFFHEMVKNPEIQDRLRDEIDEAYESGTDKTGRLPYNTVQSMEYLDMVLNETLRMYPAAGNAIFRECIQDYKLPGTNIIIKKGQEINVPTYGIHMDPTYYPDPEMFDPERFTKEARAARHPMAFLTFGQGPRQCIGSRFAIVEMKVGIVKILREYILKSGPRTPTKVDLDPEAFTLTPKTPMLIQVERRNL